MIENTYFYFMHTHVLFIFLSLVLLWLNTTTATSFGHQLVAAPGGSVHKCIDKERKALLDFKAHLQVPNDMLSTWIPKEEGDCCKWRGVTCNNQTGHVTKLDLSSYYILGEITHSLLNLSYLNHLDLSGNFFDGTIPELISNMSQLTYLDLSENQFTGSITKFLSNMTRLTYLDLSENQFTGSIPESVGSLTNLTTLDLSENNFNGTIPMSIGFLTELTELFLGGNNFTGSIPRSIGSMTKLIMLSLSENSFYGTIPTEFGNLANLGRLELSSLGSCTVESLDWLSSLSYLYYLLMDGISLAKANNWVNVMTGLQNLGKLSLEGCDLSQVMHPYSPSVNSSLSLNSLSLDNNNLNSSMFHWLCPLICKNFFSLSISGNKFGGKLSDFLNNLSRCTSAKLGDLDASSNQFTGSLSIPDEIQHFSRLSSLNLSSNLLDGTISDKLWQLPSLQWLYLSSNSLRGAISENIGKSNLFHIDISNNSLEGAFFNDDVSNFSWGIQYVDFSSNKLGPHLILILTTYLNYL